MTLYFKNLVLQLIMPGKRDLLIKKFIRTKLIVHFKCVPYLGTTAGMVVPIHWKIQQTNGPSMYFPDWTRYDQADGTGPVVPFTRTPR